MGSETVKINVSVRLFIIGKMKRRHYPVITLAGPLFTYPNETVIYQILAE